MQILDPGHVYKLDALDGETHVANTVIFVKRFRGADNHPGTTNQELLRVLIDRVKFLDGEKPWPLNEQIIHHLRMALVLHEARALIRKVEKVEITPESLVTKESDGHFIFI